MQCDQKFEKSSPIFGKISHIFLIQPNLRKSSLICEKVAKFVKSQIFGKSSPICEKVIKFVKSSQIFGKRSQIFGKSIQIFEEVSKFFEIVARFFEKVATFFEKVAKTVAEQKMVIQVTMQNEKNV
jgi:hypothetical protein